MKTISFATLAAVSLIATAVHAGEPVNKYPGSSWGSVGNTSPSEKDNFIATVHAEQGVVVANGDDWNLAPFVTGTVTVDSKGYDWNNKAVLRGGVKLEHTVPHGIVALRTGVAYEDRFRSGESDSSLFVSAEHWLGWGYGTHFPGSTWGQLGYGMSPAEKDNISLMVHAEQGLFATKFDSGRLVPFVDATISRDTKGYNWNNKNQFGAGVKYSIPMTDNGVFDVRIKYTRETMTKSGASASNVGVFATYWFGW